MDFPFEQSPMLTAKSWLEEAVGAEGSNPNAAALATVGEDGRPQVRMVLIKELGPAGAVFYTNLESRKGLALHAEPSVAICMYWKILRRQLRMEGKVQLVDGEVADRYFASRSRDTQIGAWASLQSRVLSKRAKLEKSVAGFESKFCNSSVARPTFWSGYAIVPDRIEFWLERDSRLHDRIEFYLDDGVWAHRMLYP